MAAAGTILTVEKHPGVGDDLERYRALSITFADTIRSTMGPWKRYEFEVGPGFVHISRDLAERTEQAHCLFAKGLEAMTASYLSSHRLQELIPVSDKMVRLMRESGEFGQQNHGCFFRPDIVWTECDGGVVPKIIEVNIRFPTHCFMEAAAVGNISDWHLWHGQNVAWPSAYKEIIPAFEEAFPPGKSIWIIKGREDCEDSEAFEHVMREHGRFVQVVHPAELAVNECGKLRAPCHPQQESSHVLLLELFQDELLGLSLDVLRAIGQTPRFNSFRGTFIAHNKAIMAAVWDESASAAAFAGWSSAQVKALREIVPETYVPGLLPDGVPDFVGSKDDWVLKPAASGRGHGVTLGRDLTPRAWSQLFENASEEGQWVVQRYHPSVPVCAFDHRAMMSDSSEILLKEFPMVGTTFGGPQGQFLGLGPVRYNDNDVVNVSAGGALTFPVIEKDIFENWC